MGVKLGARSLLKGRTHTSHSERGAEPEVRAIVVQTDNLSERVVGPKKAVNATPSENMFNQSTQAGS